MNVDIDFSVFTAAGGAIGNVTGQLQVYCLPQVGDIIVFSVAKPNRNIHCPKEFDGHLTVLHRTISAAAEERAPTLSLSDVTVPNKQNANDLANYLECGFDLFMDFYE